MELGVDDAPNAETRRAQEGEPGTQGLRRAEDYPALVAALRERGYDGERLDAILSANWLRVLGESLPEH